MESGSAELTEGSDLDVDLDRREFLKVQSFHGFVEALDTAVL